MDQGLIHRRPFSDALLCDVAQHLCYEVDQLAFGTYRTQPWRTTNGVPSLEDVHLSNITHEAFLVHVRVLDDFLSKTKPYKGDVLATDFCPEYTPKTTLDDVARLDIDGRLIHLTFRRAEPFQWDDRSRLALPLFGQLQRFLDDLETHHPERWAWIGPKCARARAFVDTTADGWPNPRTT